MLFFLVLACSVLSMSPCVLTTSRALVLTLEKPTEPRVTPESLPEGVIELGEGLDHLGFWGPMVPGTKTHLLTLAFLVTCGCGNTMLGVTQLAFWEIQGFIQLESIYCVLQNSLTPVGSHLAPSASLMYGEGGMVSTPFIDKETETQKTQVTLSSEGFLLEASSHSVSPEVRSSKSLSSEGL